MSAWILRFIDWLCGPEVPVVQKATGIVPHRPSVSRRDELNAARVPSPEAAAPVSDAKVEAAAKAVWETSHACEWHGTETNAGWTRTDWEDCPDDYRERFREKARTILAAAARAVSGEDKER